MGPQVPPDFTPGSPVVPSTDPQATRVVDARLGGDGKSCRPAGGGGAPAGLHWGRARLRRSVRESPSPTPANAPHKTPPTRPSKSIYSWSYAGALPWQQGNTGDLANRLSLLRWFCGDPVAGRAAARASSGPNSDFRPSLLCSSPARLTPNPGSGVQALAEGCSPSDPRPEARSGLALPALQGLRAGVRLPRETAGPVAP